MSMEKKLNKFLDELIQEVETELDEATASGNVAGYNTPGAFSDGGSKDKKRKKKISTQFGMKIVGKVDESVVNEAVIPKPIQSLIDDMVANKIQRRVVNIKDKSKHNRFMKDVKIAIDRKLLMVKHNPIKHSEMSISLGPAAQKMIESVITEKQFKGLDGIDDKTPLSKISDKQKLKIIQGTGNIISFKVPKGSDRNFWQVISKGKIKKTRNPQGYVRYILPGKMISSPFFKSEKDLVNGVDWDSVEKARRFNESVNEAKSQRPVNRWLELKNDETMHPHKKMAMGLKELKYQLRETEKFFNWYGKIKSMNELDSSDYWKRTNKHIYKIKERLINIAKTIQEIEK